MHRTRQTAKRNQGLFPKILPLLNSDDMTMIKKAPNSILDANLYFLKGSLLCVDTHHQPHIHRKTIPNNGQLIIVIR